MRRRETAIVARASRMCAWGLTALVLTLTGCGGSGPPVDTLAALLKVTATTETPPPDPGDEVPPYVLKPGDQIGVRVLTDPTLNSTVEIQMDGRVAIPWVGTVPAAGRTVAQLEKDVEAGLSVYLRHPDVSMTIDGFGPSRVYVTGEVGVPGSYRIDAGQTVLGAIAAAGGFRTTANTQEVLLLRRESATEASVHTINIQRVLKGSDQFSDPIVQHLDIIHVPRTLIADIGVFVDQFFSRLRPAFSFYLEGWEAFNVEQIRVVRVTRTVE